MKRPLLPCLGAAILALPIATAAWAQPAEPERQIEKASNAVTPPKLRKKVEPEYTKSARDAHIQGTCLLAIVVDERGIPRDIEVISPLGFGLDEKASEAISAWRFEPGLKDGRAVAVRANIEVNFRFLESWFDTKAERRRTAFNMAIRGLGSTDEKITASAVSRIRQLSKDGFPAAQSLEGRWLVDGAHGVSDPERGRQLIEKAAKKNDGSALYELARLHLDGTGMPVDKAQGMQLMQDASILGSARAQFYLGAAYEYGENVSQDLERAGRAYRLCAASGIPQCQYRLARLLLNKPRRLEREQTQAIAWLQLAESKGFDEAKELLASELPKAAPDQVKDAEKLRAQLAYKP